jgi:tryptophanyl-tRNA synthetase
MRVLSGIQPTGKLHLGNYFAAIKQHVEFQEEHEAFYFIANYHALNAIQDKDELAANTRDVALDYLALGLDPRKALLFRQSDVPEVAELTWVLATVTGKGLLDRAHSYKDKVAKGLMPSMGLYLYPVLMAADILIYRSHLVPVGQDQIQHIEMTQDMAGYFNNTYEREVFVRPEPKLNEAAVVPGVDGQKMSKSYNNTIELFSPPKTLRKRVLSIMTDSALVEAAKDPDACNVMALLRLCAESDEISEWENDYRRGGVGYGQVKQRLFELLDSWLGPARERREELAARPDEVEDILATSAASARRVAQETMADVRDACGIATASAVQGDS